MSLASTGSGYTRPEFSQMQPSGTGSVTRIYKNAAGDTIGLDEIGVQFYKTIKKNLSPIPHDLEFYVTAKITKVMRTLIHEGTGASRAISTIQMVGDYTSVSVDSGDYLAGTWTFGSNTCEVTWEGQVATVSESI